MALFCKAETSAGVTYVEQQIYPRFCFTCNPFLYDTSFPFLGSRALTQGESLKPFCPRSGGCHSWQSAQGTFSHAGGAGAGLQPEDAGAHHARTPGPSRGFRTFPQLRGGVRGLAQSVPKNLWPGRPMYSLLPGQFLLPSSTLRLGISPLPSSSSKPPPPPHSFLLSLPGLGPWEAPPGPGLTLCTGSCAGSQAGLPPQLPARAPWKGEGKGLNGRPEVEGGGPGRAPAAPVGREEKRPGGGFRFPRV